VNTLNTNPLFILTRRDISTEQQSVQSGHAVAQYLLTHPNTEWNNGTLIYLGVNNIEDLHKWIHKMHLWKVSYICFHEPDMNNEITSVASVHDRSFFKNLRTL